MTVPRPDRPDPERPGSFWSRRGTLGKTVIIVVGVLVVLTVVGSFLPDPEPTSTANDTSSSSTPPDSTQQPEETLTPTATATEAPEESATPTPEPTPAQPRPRTVSGAGQQVKSLRMREDTPLVVKATHQGGSNFIVDLVPRGGEGENLFNEIGNYKGDTLLEDAAAGRYRVRVEADGPWTIRFSQPEPPGSSKRLPGTVRGTGAKVVPVRSTSDMQPIINATHRGESNFIVDIVGYGDEASGSENLYNDIGNFKGETLMDELPEGDYLLHVEADGPWTVRFSDD